MVISKLHEMIKECHYKVIEQTEIKDLITAAFKTTDEEFLNKAVSFIIDSIILGRVSSYEKKMLFSMYGSVGNKMFLSRNSEEGKFEYKRIKSDFLESSLSVGMATFLEVFDGCFVNRAFLLPKLRKLFKNYKFKKINTINDYSVLFFTFKLFDMKCNTTDDKDEQNEFADRLAEECFDKLHNPRNKKAVTVSCESLLQYVKLFVEGAYVMDNYVRIMISFVQAIHQSVSLPSHIKYDFFQRFMRHIEVINRLIYEAQQAEKRECECSAHGARVEEYYDISKVSKFNYNSIQKAKKQENSESTVSTLKEFQKNIQWLAKNTSKWYSRSRNELYRCSAAIYDSIMSLLKQPDEFEDISFDVLQRFQSLGLEVGDKILSAESFLFQLMFDEGRQELKPIVKSSRSKDNPYILLLFSTEDLSQLDVLEESVESICIKIKEHQVIYQNEMSKIHKIVTKTIPMLSAKDYKEILTTASLDNFNIPILSASADDSYYKRVLYNICLIL